MSNVVALARQPVAEPADPVAMFAPPGDTPEMMELRRKLLRARHIASIGIGRWNHHGPDARALFVLIAAQASRAAYAPLSQDHLTMAVAFCRRLLLAASEADQLESIGA